MKFSVLPIVAATASASLAATAVEPTEANVYPHDSATYVKKVAVNFLEFVAVQAPRASSSSAKDTHVVSAFIRGVDDYGCVVSNFVGDRIPLKQKKLALTKDVALGLPVQHENGRNIVKFEFDYYCNSNIHGHRTFDMRPFAAPAKAAGDALLDLTPVVIETGLNTVVSVGNAVPFIRNAEVNDIVVSVNPVNARFIKNGLRRCEVKTEVTIGKTTNTYKTKVNFETSPNQGAVYKLPISRTDAAIHQTADVNVSIKCGVAQETHSAKLMLVKTENISMDAEAEERM